MLKKHVGRVPVPELDGKGACSSDGWGESDMKHWPFIFILPAMLFIAVPADSPSADSNSCVTCHTDGAKLKFLVIPPKIHAEGEG